MKKILVILIPLGFGILFVLPIIFVKLFLAPVEVKTEITTPGQRHYKNSQFSLDVPQEWKVRVIGSDGYSKYAVMTEPVQNLDHVRFMINFELHRSYQFQDPKPSDVLQSEINKAKKVSLNFYDYTQQNIVIGSNRGVHYEYTVLQNWVPNFEFDNLITFLFNYFFSRQKSGIVRENIHFGGTIFVNAGDLYNISYSAPADSYNKYKQTFEKIERSLRLVAHKGE